MVYFVGRTPFRLRNKLGYLLEPQPVESTGLDEAFRYKEYQSSGEVLGRFSSPQGKLLSRTLPAALCWAMNRRVNQKEGFGGAHGRDIKMLEGSE